MISESRREVLAVTNAEALAALENELGATAPAGIAALEASDLEALRQALATARFHQKDALASAMDDGLRFVPRVLRGTVKKALFG